MNKIILLTLAGFLCLIINGCASVRTYPVTKERVDQDLSTGNRGYLLGKPKSSQDKPRKTTRQMQVFEVELYPIGKRGKSVSSKPVKNSAQQQTPAIKSVVVQPRGMHKVKVMKRYTVRKGDTLQRISKKFYGTTKRWQDIYKANKKILKSPERLYAGQVIEIPVEEVVGVK